MRPAPCGGKDDACIREGLVHRRVAVDIPAQLDPTTGQRRDVLTDVVDDGAQVDIDIPVLDGERAGATATITKLHQTLSADLLTGRNWVNTLASQHWKKNSAVRNSTQWTRLTRPPTEPMFPRRPVAPNRKGSSHPAEP